MKALFARRGAMLAALCLGICSAGAGAQEPDTGASSLPAPFLALQPMAQTQKAVFADGAHGELLDVNESVGRWYLLSVQEADGVRRIAHLDAGVENASKLTIAAQGLSVERNGQSRICPLGNKGDRDLVFSDAGRPFGLVPACGVWIRGSATGSKSTLEAATDLLRSTGSAGEAIINLQKNLFAHSGDSAESAEGPVARSSTQGPPAPTFASAPEAIAAPNLSIAVPGGNNAVKPGAWMPAADAPNVWVSVASPNLAGGADSALVYLMAIDLNAFHGHYAVGVDHPMLNWSDRAPGPHTGPGPDGFSQIMPLRREGMVPPWEQAGVGMVFAGGFKREHSAFKRGPRAAANHGSHYGFVEAGVVLSPLQPGLATLWQRLGEPVKMGPWSAEEQKRGVDGLIFARQNGLPLVTGGQLGSDLSAFSATGNWSGNHEGKPETMRSAVCLIGQGKAQFLAYAVFSSAEPQEMGKLLKAYGCQEAMQLDMNAPELTYGALIVRDEKGAPKAAPLLSSMGRGPSGGRFVNTPDTRDFFYWSRGPRR